MLFIVILLKLQVKRQLIQTNKNKKIDSEKNKIERRKNNKEKEKKYTKKRSSLSAQV